MRARGDRGVQHTHDWVGPDVIMNMPKAVEPQSARGPRQEKQPSFEEGDC